MVKYEDFTLWDSILLESLNESMAHIDEDIPLEEYLESGGFIDFLKEYGYKFGKMSVVYKKTGIEAIKRMKPIKGILCLYCSHCVKRIFE